MSLRDLEERSRVPGRTIRYYIAEGMLPGAAARGKGAAYGEEHLLRLQLIRRLADQHVPIREIKQRLDGLRLDEVRELLAAEEPAEPRSPKEYVAAMLARAGQPDRATAPRAPQRRLHDAPATAASAGPAPEGWQRWELAPGVELHARAGAAATHRALIARLLDAARTP